MQAYNAQKAGAKAVIVMDDRDESLLTMSNPEDRPELAKLKNDINIPAGLIRQVSCCRALTRFDLGQSAVLCSA